MKNRSMKVMRQSGYQYRSVPAIVLKGQWLQAAGYDIGDYILVRCEDGRLIIEQDKERAQLEEAEKAFLDREKRSLKKRFEDEKEQILARFVAEQEAGYGIREVRE